MVNTTEELLGRVSLFQRMEKKDIRSLAKLVKEQSYEPGRLIVQEGQPGLGLYIISQGEVDVIRAGQVIDHLKEGDFFGEMALLDDLPRTADVRAVTTVHCLTLAKWEFLGELTAHPVMALPMLPMLSRRIRNAEERMNRLRQELARPE